MKLIFHMACKIKSSDSETFLILDFQAQHHFHFRNSKRFLNANISSVMLTQQTSSLFLSALMLCDF